MGEKSRGNWQVDVNFCKCGKIIKKNIDCRCKSDIIVSSERRDSEKSNQSKN